MAVIRLVLGLSQLAAAAGLPTTQLLPVIRAVVAVAAHWLWAVQARSVKVLRAAVPGLPKAAAAVAQARWEEITSAETVFNQASTARQLIALVAVGG
jgi:hypothetical protein